jgi:polyhydroxyalkanoate synthesis repressor PhaR
MNDTTNAPPPPGATPPHAAAPNAAGPTAPGGDSGKEPVKIKKYANRRLYNTATSSYVTLEHLCQMVKQNTDFIVHDAKTGEDITRSVLTQIIVEEEGKGGQNMLPVAFLRQLISFYGDNLQALVPRYLESSMAAFARNQEQMRTAMQQAFGGIFPFAATLGGTPLGAPLSAPLGSIEEIGKQNMALMQNALKMWSPFGFEGGAGTGAAPTATPEPGANVKGDESLDELRRQLEEMQARLTTLTKKS